MFGQTFVFFPCQYLFMNAHWKKNCDILVVNWTFSQSSDWTFWTEKWTLTIWVFLSLKESDSIMVFVINLFWIGKLVFFLSKWRRKCISVKISRFFCEDERKCLISLNGCEYCHVWRMMRRGVRVKCWIVLHWLSRFERMVWGLRERSLWKKLKWTRVTVYKS